MATARAREAWGHTSAVLSMLANANRDPKKKSSPFVPADFDPTRPPKAATKPTITADNFDVLKIIFVDGQREQQR